MNASKILTHHEVAHRCEVLSQLALGAMRKNLALIPEHIAYMSDEESPMPEQARAWLATLAKDVRVSKQAGSTAIMHEVHDLLMSQWSPFTTTIPFARELQYLLGKECEQILVSASLVCWYGLAPTVFDSTGRQWRWSLSETIINAKQYWRAHVTFFALRSMIHSVPEDKQTSMRATNTPLSIVAGYAPYVAPYGVLPAPSWYLAMTKYCAEVANEEQEMTWEARLADRSHDDKVMASNKRIRGTD